MLEFKADKSLFIDEELVQINSGTMMNEILISSLDCKVKLDKNLTLENFCHMLFDIKNFINLYCVEEYEVGRVLFSSGKLQEGFDFIRIYKNLEVDSEGNFDINVCSELGNYNENGSINQSVGNLKILLDENLVDGDEILNKENNLKISFTLAEIVRVLYEDFLYSLKRDNILI